MNLQENLKKTFQSKLILITKEKKISQKNVCQELKLSQSTVSNWYQGKSVPKEDKLKALSDLLNIPVSFWTEKPDTSENNNSDPHYYLDEETRMAAEDLRTNKDLKLLFNDARNASSEDLRAIHTMLLALKRKEQHLEEE